jgi:ribonuclease HI
MIKMIADACCKIPNSNIKGRIGRGKAACGILIIDDNGNEFTFKKYLGDQLTVPEAEFKALIYGLDQASGICRNEVEVWMDSELVINWMNGAYRMKKEHIRPLFDEAKKNCHRFKSVSFNHHSRGSVSAKKADVLANAAFRESQSF